MTVGHTRDMAKDHSVCVGVAKDCIVENFLDARGIDIYDLPITYDGSESAKVMWETITPETDFRAAMRYVDALALEYLEDGTASHYCD